MKNRVWFLSVIALMMSAISADAAFQRRTQGKLSVYYEAPDSLYADETLKLAVRMIEEMTTDLRLTNFDTLHLFLAPSRSFFRESIRGVMPSWTQGFAIPERRTLMIKSPRWDRPENNFSQTLSHELLHLMLAGKIGRREMPRWLDEGLALFYTDDVSWSTKTALSKALLTHSVIPLADIDQVLHFERHRAELAYQESYSAATYLLSTYDIEALNIIMDHLAAGASLDVAFFNATGSSFADFESEWLRTAQKQQRWFWMTEMGDFIWYLALGLFILALVLIRLRNRKKIKEWETEEAGPEETGEWRTPGTDPLATGDQTPGPDDDWLDKDEKI